LVLDDTSLIPRFPLLLQLTGFVRVKKMTFQIDENLITVIRSNPGISQNRVASPQVAEHSITYSGNRIARLVALGKNRDEVDRFGQRRPWWAFWRGV
jgi:hypothetical protein